MKLEGRAIHLAGMLDQLTVGPPPPEFRRLGLMVKLRGLRAQVKVALKILGKENSPK